MRRRILIVLLAMVLVACMTAAVFVYFDFVSDTILQESTAHLAEIFHQANQTLYNLVSVNWSRMRMWEPYLSIAESEQDIAAYVARAREESNFTDFYFISRNGFYYSIDGQQGYLELRGRLADLILHNQPVVINSVVPDKPEIIVFAIPATPGSYQGFDYEAIAVTYNNTDLVEALQISAFDGQASTFAVLPDGRVVVDNGNQNLGSIHNLLALLDDPDRLSKEKYDALVNDFQEGRSGAVMFKLDGRAHYFVYKAALFQDWMVVGIVPADVVNAAMSDLQSATITAVGTITATLAVVLLLLVVQRSRLKLRRKDNELLSRDELFAKLSVNVDDVFLMLDAQQLRVDYISPNVEKLLGIPLEQARSDVHALEQPEDSSKDTARFLDYLTFIHPGQQLEWDREFRHRVTGEMRWFHIIAFCSVIQGETKYILDLSDRTKERKNSQALEEAVETAENANRAKTTFLNNMSHDIRTPMNAIIGFTNIAMKLEPKPEVRSCLQKISNSSEHLLTLINDVLDISRIESGKIRYAPIPVDITTVAEAVVSITQGFLTDRELHFQCRLSPAPHPYVLADAVRIREVLVNILGNAVKFTPNGGSITFEADYLSAEDDQHIRVRYRVSDTGVGMSEEFQGRLFDEFSQEENSARTQYKGTGLGLAITKRYVDLMGGSILVQSKKGCGSTFTVILPLECTDESRVERREVPLAQINLSGVNILMAEDNDLNAEIATVQMEALGIRLTRAVNGREAVSLFQSNPPGTYDLILMDIMMPEMNGYEATRAIRELNRPDAAAIPIIAMTANAFAEDVQASLDAGMNGHLAKPIVMDEVVKTIARNLRNL